MPAKWNNTNTDGPPEDEQDVLISVNGIYYDAVYDKKNNLYKTTRYSAVSFDPRHHVIYWCKFTPPPKKI